MKIARQVGHISMVLALWSLASTGFAASTVTVTVTGSGTVTSSPAGIDCPDTCSADFGNSETVTLTASPSEDFLGWAGDCVGNDPVCLVRANRDRNATAQFVVDPDRKPFVLVAPEGGDYTSPEDAIANISEGDSWCRDTPEFFEDYETYDACLIKIAPGLYELSETLMPPAKVRMVGSGMDLTELRAAPGVALAIQTAYPMAFVDIQDLTVTNIGGDGARSIGISLFRMDLSRVRVSVSGASENTGVVSPIDDSELTLSDSEIVARGGSVSIALQGFGWGSIRSSSITARDATNENQGFRFETPSEFGGRVELIDSHVLATGGQSANGIFFEEEAGRLVVDGGSSVAINATVRNVALSVVDIDMNFSARGVDFSARGGSEAIAVLLFASSLNSFRLIDVEAAASGGGSSDAIRVSVLGPELGIELRNSVARGDDVGLRIVEAFGPLDIRINNSQLGGASASLSNEALSSQSRLRIGATQLDGPFTPNAADTVCALVYDGDYNTYASTCPP